MLDNAIQPTDHAGDHKRGHAPPSPAWSDPHHGGRAAGGGVRVHLYGEPTDAGRQVQCLAADQRGADETAGAAADAAGEAGVTGYCAAAARADASVEPVASSALASSNCSAARRA